MNSHDLDTLVSSARQQYRAAYLQMAGRTDHWDLVASASGVLLIERQHANRRTPLVFNVQGLSEEQLLAEMAKQLNRLRFEVKEWCQQASFDAAFNDIFKS